MGWIDGCGGGRVQTSWHLSILIPSKKGKTLAEKRKTLAIAGILDYN